MGRKYKVYKVKSRLELSTFNFQLSTSRNGVSEC